MASRLCGGCWRLECCCPVERERFDQVVAQLERERAKSAVLRNVLTVLLSTSATPVPCQDLPNLGRVATLALDGDECQTAAEN